MRVSGSSNETRAAFATNAVLATSFMCAAWPRKTWSQNVCSRDDTLTRFEIFYVLWPV